MVSRKYSEEKTAGLTSAENVSFKNTGDKFLLKMIMKRGRVLKLINMHSSPMANSTANLSAAGL